MAKKREIRNSTAEFLISQVGVPAIGQHLANVSETGELNEETTISKMETVQKEGSRTVKRSVVMYKLRAFCGSILCAALPFEKEET